MKRNKNNNNFASKRKVGDIVEKRFTLPATVLATGAGTTIPVTSITSAQVQSTPATEWSSFAARYQQYRVKSLKVIGKAINPVQSATISHSTLYMGDYISNSSAPASAAQVLADESIKIVGTDEDFTYLITWSGNPNAKLWTATVGTPAGANQYAFVCASPATPPLTTATTYYSLVVEWIVEFRGSQ